MNELLLSMLLTSLHCNDAYIITSVEQESIAKEIDKLCVSPERRSAELCETAVIKNLAHKTDETLSIYKSEHGYTAEFRNDDMSHFEGPVIVSLTPGEGDDRGLFFQTEDQFSFMVETRMFTGPSWKRTEGATVVYKNKFGKDDMYVFTSCSIDWE